MQPAVDRWTVVHASACQSSRTAQPAAETLRENGASHELGLPWGPCDDMQGAILYWKPGDTASKGWETGPPGLQSRSATLAVTARVDLWGSTLLAPIDEAVFTFRRRGEKA